MTGIAVVIADSREQRREVRAGEPFPGEAVLMAGQLIPLPELSPPVPEQLSPGECIGLWVDLMNACEQFLLGGLRREVGPSGDVQAAYRRWYAEQRQENDQTLRRMMGELGRPESS